MLNHLFLNRSGACLLGIFTLFFLIYCDLTTPTLGKGTLPEGHTEVQDGFYHKPGLDNPFRKKTGCNTSKCHQKDLRGGLGEVNEVKIVAPSCYQCHEKKWEGDDEGD